MGRLPPRCDLRVLVCDRRRLCLDEREGSQRCDPLGADLHVVHASRDLCAIGRPLCATQGDVTARADEIAALPTAPPCLMGQKLDFCCRFFRQEAISALELLRQAPCSIALVEKGHSAGAFIRRAPWRWHCAFVDPRLLERDTSLVSTPASLNHREVEARVPRQLAQVPEGPLLCPQRLLQLGHRRRFRSPGELRRRRGAGLGTAVRLVAQPAFQ